MQSIIGSGEYQIRLGRIKKIDFFQGRTSILLLRKLDTVYGNSHAEEWINFFDNENGPKFAAWVRQGKFTENEFVGIKCRNKNGWLTGYQITRQGILQTEDTHVLIGYLCKEPYSRYGRIQLQIPVTVKVEGKYTGMLNFVSVNNLELQELEKGSRIAAVVTSEKGIKLADGNAAMQSIAQDIMVC